MVPWPEVPWNVFFFNDTATTEIYTLSLHDALPILCAALADAGLRDLGDPVVAEDVVVERAQVGWTVALPGGEHIPGDRKSTRLNSSHANISHAVFCLKQKTRLPCILQPLRLQASSR